jgi:diadenosine tetraphosphate (Ap4A) HIT family hydrolase
MSCVFCDIVAGHVPAGVVLQDEVVAVRESWA